MGLIGEPQAQCIRDGASECKRNLLGASGCSGMWLIVDEYLPLVDAKACGESSGVGE
jgi:hypothetical protein